MDGWNTTFLLGWPIFRGYVSFREGKYFPPWIYEHIEYVDIDHNKHRIYDPWSCRETLYIYINTNIWKISKHGCKSSAVITSDIPSYSFHIWCVKKNCWTFNFDEHFSPQTYSSFCVWHGIWASTSLLSHLVSLKGTRRPGGGTTFASGRQIHCQVGS